MAERPVRILVAGDLRLDRVVVGLANVPDALTARLIDASYESARRVFDAALATPIDAVVLVGSLVEAPLAGPRGCLFLLDQFERLAARKVPVYWFAPRGTNNWPETLPLPANVIRLPTPAAQLLDVVRDEQTVATIYAPGTDRNQPSADPLSFATVPTLAVAADHCTAAPAQPLATCWLLGGRHQRTTQPQGRGVVHWPGVTQAAAPDETGAHGCSIFEWDTGALLPRIVPIDTDAVRWLEQAVIVDAVATLETVEATLHEQAQQLAAQHGDRTLLIRWKLKGAGAVLSTLRRQSAAEALLGRLRPRASATSFSVYHAAIDVALAAPAPVHDDTLLDHYLQRFAGTAEHDSPAAESLHTLSEVAPAGWSSEVAARWTMPPIDPIAQQRLIDEAAWLGVDLLSAANAKAAEEIRA